jgi:hypothetical protein
MANSSLQFGHDFRTNKFNNANKERIANNEMQMLRESHLNQKILEYIRQNGGKYPTEEQMAEMSKPRLFS